MRYIDDRRSIYDEQFSEDPLTGVGTGGGRRKHWRAKDAIGSQSVGSYTDSHFVRCVEKHWAPDTFDDTGRVLYHRGA